MTNFKNKPATTALNVIGHAANAVVWWAVLKGGVPEWVAWIYFGANVFCLLVTGIQLLVLVWNEL